MIEETYKAVEEARHVASRFDLSGQIEIADFTAKGNINRQTYLVAAGPSNHRAEYLLQLLNPAVFKQPRAVMQSMISCLDAQQKAIKEGMLRDGEEWETFHLIPTKEGKPFCEIEDEIGLRCWRMMTRIRPACAYKSLREIPNPDMRLRIAEEAGKGLALFGALTSGMNPAQVRCPLPGYRDTDLYYEQLHSILEGNRTLREAAPRFPADEILRQNVEQHFIVQTNFEEYRRRRNDPQINALIELALEQKPFALTLSYALKSKSINTVVVHGDTKLDNFLFKPVTGNVKALIDLDTIMPHTWLSDWGDMIRSLVNVAGEREKDPDKIDVDVEIFKAVAQGYLHTARYIDLMEIELMADAPSIMALELGVRFLTDYLRGDGYFMLGPADPPDLNKTRALVQFRLFEKMRMKINLLKRCIKESLQSVTGSP
jgi:Ser/Thr protein kinase RdoA (MazF antagonist)